MKKGTILNAEELKSRKEKNRNTLYIQSIPIRRMAGFLLISFGIFLHKIALLTDLSWSIIFIFYGVILSYNMITFSVMVLFFKRIKRVNIGDIILLLDPVIFVVAIYVSGEVRSLFFVLLIIRTADHVFVSFRKAMVYSHYSVFLYGLLLIYLVFVEHHDIFWPYEVLKLTIVYSVNIYISLVARMGDRFKLRLNSTILTAKNELMKRVETEAKLNEKNIRLNQLNDELQQSVEQINTLQGLLPICAKCKKIRDGKGYWNQLEAYIESRSAAQFSHSLCGTCADELYGSKKWYQKMRLNKDDQQK